MKKLLYTFIALLIVAIFSKPLHSIEIEHNVNLPNSSDSLKVGLVLCGGGAKGAAHIGVLKKLEEVGIRPDLIVGTSMGALVGGMYAMGYSANQLDSIVSNADWDFLLSDQTKRSDVGFAKKKNDDIFLINIPFHTIFSNTKNKEEVSIMKNLPDGFISGNNVLNLLNGLAIGYQDSIDFNKLPIPFACIATDLSTGEELVIKEGRLPLALRASMAIPGYFSPVEINGKVLVDGGVVNNFPVDVAISMGANVIIGVDVQTDLYGPEDLKSIDAVLFQLIGLLGNEKFKQNKERVNIYIKPDVSQFGTLSFDKESISTLVENGYKQADSCDSHLRVLATNLKNTRRYSDKELTNRAKDIYSSTFNVGKIEINGVDDSEKSMLINMTGLKDSSLVTGVQINRAISLLNGTQAFSNVTYQLGLPKSSDQNSEQGFSKLTFNLVKGPTNIFSLGARYDTEEAAAILLHLGINQYGFSGSKYDLTTRLSYNPYIKLGYSYMFKNFPRLDINYQFSSNDLNIYSGNSSKNNIEYLYNTLDVAFANIKYFKFFDSRIGVKWQSFKYNKFLTENETVPPIADKTSHYLSIYTQGVVDTKDDKTFPTSGSYIGAEVAYYFHASHRDFKPFLDINFSIEWIADLGDGFVLSPQVYARTVFNNKGEIPFYNYVGGLQPGRYIAHQLPFVGISYASVFSNSVSILRADLRKHMGKSHYLYAMTNYMVVADKINHIFSEEGREYIGFGLQYSYNTTVGPLSLNLNWSNYKRDKIGAYLSFGFFF